MAEDRIKVSGTNGTVISLVIWPVMVPDTFIPSPDTYIPSLGFDHFECRSWKSIHRHLFVTILSHLFCARTRQQLSPSDDVFSGELLTTEQVRRAANVVLESHDLPPRIRQKRYEDEAARQLYHTRRNAQAATSHHATRRKRLAELGIDPDKIKSVRPKTPGHPPDRKSNLALSS